jgi:hypothetical protein
MSSIVGRMAATGNDARHERSDGLAAAFRAMGAGEEDAAAAGDGEGRACASRLQPSRATRSEVAATARASEGTKHTCGIYHGRPAAIVVWQ